MNRKTYEALVASVEKWRKNATVPAIDGRVGANDCPLCRLFMARNCKGCPVSAAVKDSFCDRTPYWSAAYARWAAREHVGGEAEWQVAAQREADFLAALVPAGGPDE